MTHRIPSRRWQENPEHRVGQALLNRVKQAANPGTPLPVAEHHDSNREVRTTRHIQEQ